MLVNPEDIPDFDIVAPNYLQLVSPSSLQCVDKLNLLIAMLLVVLPRRRANETLIYINAASETMI